LVTSVAESGMPLGVAVERRHEVSYLTVSGELTGTTYRTLRDAITEAALAESRAVVVDINDLSVFSDSAWSAFTSARRQVSIWPDVPILLVCGRPERRRTISRCGVARHVQVHPTHESAACAVGVRSLHGRRRSRIQLPAGTVSFGVARNLIADLLSAWNQFDLVPVASTVATVFIDNVLVHTGSAPVLIIESCRAIVTVAVEDGSHVPAGRHDDADCGAEVVSGLAMVSALCRSWGSTPTSSGKTVWALIGSENRI
jgi:anti-anti-sigma factor